MRATVLLALLLFPLLPLTAIAADGTVSVIHSDMHDGSAVILSLDSVPKVTFTR